jgi:type IV secretory pathway VirJ component
MQQAHPDQVKRQERAAGIVPALQQWLALPVSAAQPNGPAGIADLPLVEVSRHSGQGVLAVVYSGDGGWRDIDKTLGEELARHDLAVLGVDVLRYFWKKRSPEQVGADLERMLNHYLEAWNLRRVMLVGYSFGADILPFAYNRLSAENRGHIIQISLLSPSLTTDFEVHVGGWLGLGPGPDARSIVPEYQRIPTTLLQCYYGREEAAESLCVAPPHGAAENFPLQGGHHFDGDYVRLGQKLLEGLQRRMGGH